VTQHPQEKEKEDFWRMLWDHSAQTVVLFSPTDEKVSFSHSHRNEFKLKGFVRIYKKMFQIIFWGEVSSNSSLKQIATHFITFKHSILIRVIE
jgi:hypothetical protein